MKLENIIKILALFTIVVITIIMMKQCSQVKQFDTRELYFPEEVMKYMLNARDSFKNNFEKK